MTFLSKRNKQSIIRHIKLARKQRTILFSDIVDSTRFWSVHGDIQGRLMLDRHNWLLFPIVKKYKGKIIKTIGDAIFASFKIPDQALQAAMAMQQILNKERKTNPAFAMKVRIGLHTGDTIVEAHDIYGDTVNIASRIENRGKGNQILLSSETRALLQSKNFPLYPLESFKPKGKSELLKIYRCQWDEAPDLLQNLKLPTRLPLIPRQRYEMFFYALSGVGLGWLFIQLYFRFLLSENEALALIFFNPFLLFTDFPLWLIPIALILAGLVWLVRRYMFSTIALPVMHVIKGLFGFFLFFTITYAGLHIFPKSVAPYLYEVQFESRQLFVKTVAPKAVVREEPSLNADPVLMLKRHQSLLLSDIKYQNNITWNKVLVRRETYGWVPRVLPPHFGVAEKRITLTDKFYIRRLDIIALVFGLLGFIWGILTFHIRPA